MTEGVVEDSSGSKPSPGYRIYSTSVLAFFFRAILEAGLGGTAEADPVAEPDDVVDADLVDEPEVDADLVGEPGDEVDADLDQDLEADGDESSACAPYLARQMSCLGSRTPGVKDTPFLGSAWGAKEAGRRLLPGEPRRDLRSTY